MAGVLTSDDHPGPGPAPSSSGRLWRLLTAKLRAAPVAAPFRDSDFEPEPQWLEDSEPTPSHGCRLGVD